MVASTGPRSSDVTAGECPFCRPSALRRNLVTETPSFWLVCDRRPVVEGHLLLIPKAHYRCFGTVPPSLDDELLALRNDVADFLDNHYAPPVFFEHGVAGQTVFHAHLHALPGWVSLVPRLRDEPKFTVVQGIGGLRSFYPAHGPYFYYEERGETYATAPARASPGQLCELFGAALETEGLSRLAESQSRLAIRRTKAAWAKVHERSVLG